MLPKLWINEDCLLIGLTRLHIMLLLIGILAYTAIWYAIGKGWFKRLFDMWMVKRRMRK